MLLFLGVACAAPSPPPVSPALASLTTVPMGLDRYRPVPGDNALTPAKIALGRDLFFDSLLSDDGTKACATCHNPRYSFTDGRPVSIGVHGRVGRRNVPTLVNRAYGKSFFWDGRIRTLEDQVLQPIQDSLEMGMTLDQVVSRLRRDPVYASRFNDTFGRDPISEDVARALASYVRTILSGNAPFDRYTRSKNVEVPAAFQRGLRVFEQKGCVVCHVGPTLTDEQFHNTGVAWRDSVLADSGRYLVSGIPKDRGAFKTPTLREVARTAPYMHDGSLATLDDVIEFYDQGGRLNPFLDPLIHPLNLTADDRLALRVFLESLSGVVQGER